MKNIKEKCIALICIFMFYVIVCPGVNKNKQNVFGRRTSLASFCSIPLMVITILAIIVVLFYDQISKIWI